MKTFEECYRVILQQKFPEKQNAHNGLLRQLANATAIEAAELYAKEKLKGLLEEVRQSAIDYRQDWNIEAATPCDRIATRIEELINEPNTP